MSYSVKEIFYTLQGEGVRTGRPAVFLRFSGCNLWTGREEDRTAAVCQFCDTDFFGLDGTLGGRYPTAEALASVVRATWTGDLSGTPYVVCTGGEPLLQLDEPLINALHANGFEVAVETNGTQVAPAGLDWVCMSPKAGTTLAITTGDELKLVFPQRELSPEQFEGFAFKNLFLQPMDGACVTDNTKRAIEYCLAHPRWRLSVQTHKIVGIR